VRARARGGGAGRPPLRGARDRGRCERTERRLRASRGRAGLRRCCRNRGSERAKGLWSLTERYLDRLEGLAGDALLRTGSLRLAADPDERAELEAEYEALREDGFEVEWRNKLAEPIRGRFAGAIFHAPYGSLQPARWVRRLAARAAEAGAELREHERVESLDELEADNVVLATDGYTQGLLPELDEAFTPTRGQVLVTERWDGSCSPARTTPGTATTTGSRPRRGGSSPEGSGTRRSITSTRLKRR
jgi:glycine/D-amino acid oxidase-like deaminating enzyme